MCKRPCVIIWADQTMGGGSVRVLRGGEGTREDEGRGGQGGKDPAAHAQLSSRAPLTCRQGIGLGCPFLRTVRVCDTAECCWAPLAANGTRRPGCPWALSCSTSCTRGWRWNPHTARQRPFRAIDQSSKQARPVALAQTRRCAWGHLGKDAKEEACKSAAAAVVGP